MSLNLDIINIPVRCTSFPLQQTFIYKYFGALHLFLFLMQQSCKIFVEIHSESVTTGAEHRNIKFKLSVDSK
jgi:hypothetical protein